MVELRRITTYPVKSLDPHDAETAELGPAGALAGDREYAVVARPADEPHDPETASVGGSGVYVNGKRTAAVHCLRSSFDPDSRTLTLRVHGEDERHEFDLSERGDLNEWLSAYFGSEVSVRREPVGG
ncbi:MOSC N-terminal beta barrel domain-containing protein [Halomarina litorea]|uniref:MOSC N-terminal beta barrel domain-containing protein n=1 Tax=Halomarina litorea TaxID=2961595 RepID=UPI0034A3A9EE